MEFLVARKSYSGRCGDRGMEGLKPYQTSPKAPIPTGCKSVYLQIHHVTIELSFSSRKKREAYRLVISKVVPKIWARTNSAILDQERA
jgi:hypothetical protein